MVLLRKERVGSRYRNLFTRTLCQKTTTCYQPSIITRAERPYFINIHEELSRKPFFTYPPFLIYPPKVVTDAGIM